MHSGPHIAHSESKKSAAAEYLAIEMSRFARLASANGFALLAYLIDMAVLEAWREANESKQNDGGPAQLCRCLNPQTQSSPDRANHRSEMR